GDPKTLAETTVLMDDLADTYASLAKGPKREERLKHAIDIKEKLYGHYDRRLVRHLYELYILYNLQGRFTEAKSSLEHIIAVLEHNQLYESELPNRLGELAGIDTQLRHYYEA